MGVLSRAAVLLAVALLVPLLILAVVDLAVTAAAESRLSAAVSDALGVDADVELGPWPATPRLLGGTLSVDVEVIGPADDREDTALRSLRVELSGVDLAEDRQSFTAEDADLELSLDPAQAPFGASTATGTAAGIRATFGEDSSTLTADQVDLRAGERAQVSATDLRAALEHPTDGLERTELTAATATLTAGEDDGTGRLPMDVDTLDVRLEELDLAHGGQAPTSVRARRALVEVAGLPLEGGDVRLDTVEATIPNLAIDHPRGATQLVVEGDDATFSALLDEQDLAELIPGPGDVELVDGAVRIRVGPIAVDVDVQADGGRLLLTPELPRALAALFGDVPSATVTPQLPEGLVLSEVVVAPDGLLLGGGGDRIVLPLR